MNEQEIIKLEQIIREGTRKSFQNLLIEKKRKGEYISFANNGKVMTVKAASYNEIRKKLIKE